MTYLEKDGTIAVPLPEMLTISTVEKALDELRKFGPGDRPVIDASGVMCIDLAGLQLLIAVIGTDGGATRSRLAAISPAVEAAFERAGFTLPMMN